MSIPSYLILILFTAQLAYGYTVVLTSGKRIEGTLINDQASTVVIKDSKGVLISFKKSMLDLAAMSSANRETGSPTVDSAPSKKRARSLVEIASESRQQRTGKSKILTLDDLDEVTAVSVMGSEVDETSRTSVKVATPEREWQSRLWSLKREVNRLREKKITAESSCEEAKQKQYAARTTPGRKPVDLMSTYKESSQCRRLEEIEAQLQEAELRWEKAREEARRAGISWQSLE